MVNDQQILDQLRRQLADAGRPAARVNLDAIKSGGRRRARRAALAKAVTGLAALAVAAAGLVWWTANDVRTAPEPADVVQPTDPPPTPELTGLLESTGDNDAAALELAGVFEQALARVDVTTPGEARARWLIATPSGLFDESGEVIGWRMSWSGREYPGWLVTAELQVAEPDLPTEVWDDRISCEETPGAGRGCTEVELSDGRVMIFGETNAYSPTAWCPEVAVRSPNDWHLTIRVVPLADELPADQDDYTGPVTHDQLRELAVLEFWNQVPMPVPQAG